MVVSDGCFSHPSLEDNSCFGFNSGWEENIEDTSRTGASLERDDHPSQDLLAESHE